MNKELAKKIYDLKQEFNHGRRGIVYISEFEKNKYLIKQRKKNSKSPGTIHNEYEFNKKLNKIGIGPKIYFYSKEEDFLIREFIEGEGIGEWLNNASLNDLKKIISELITQARKMDLAQINKYELTNPYKDIIITKNNKPIIIDFERCRHTDKPKNVTQILQFLVRNNTIKKLALKKIVFDKLKIIELGENYRRNFNEESLDIIRKYIMGCLDNT